MLKVNRFLPYFSVLYVSIPYIFRRYQVIISTSAIIEPYCYKQTAELFGAASYF